MEACASSQMLLLLLLAPSLVLLLGVSIDVGSLDELVVTADGTVVVGVAAIDTLGAAGLVVPASDGVHPHVTAADA